MKILMIFALNILLFLNAIYCFYNDDIFNRHLLVQNFPKEINSTHFSCDNDTKIIRFDSINDDYCDCDDGSDENKTNACAKGTFLCKNQLYYPLVISTSKLNDGYCDCCDGSDEFSEANHCNNKCLVLSKKEYSILENDFITLSQVVSSYNSEDNEKYFSYHKNLMGNFMEEMKRYEKLRNDYYLLKSYAKKVEEKLVEEPDDKYIDANGISLKQLNEKIFSISENFKKIERYISENLPGIESYLSFGVYKDLIDDCIDVSYDKYNCQMCGNKMSCRGETKKNKMKTNNFGKISKIDGNVAYFTGGGRCRRYSVNLSARVIFECGFIEEFKLLKKENKCLYIFSYVSKLGCNNFKLNEIESKINLILK